VVIGLSLAHRADDHALPSSPSTGSTPLSRDTE
jgi:hypothetical protein